MTEFTKHLETYLNYWFKDFEEPAIKKRWGNTDEAQSFLEKYWLSENEFIECWKQRQDSLFVSGKELPEMIFQSNYLIDACLGVSLFTKDTFQKLQSVMKIIGEKSFVVIQHTQDYTMGEPMFRLKFPITITWEELLKGNYISSVLLTMQYNQYFVFGESASWAKYAATDQLYPIDFYAFEERHKSIFEQIIDRSK